MNKSIFLILFLLLAAITAQSQTWTNPLTLTGEWDAYGIGDPYILKYRGTYYLYCSTKDNNIGVKCWSSKNLMNWSGPYMCSTDAITKGAYAPEVVYWNGKFYMYTSPAGNGHYVLSSISPTGPFAVVTTNLGKSIDGSVYINDDGNWYFYHASGSGVLGCYMPNPTSFGTDVNLGACMGNNWTEGPCVFKRNGINYLFYTGNHVISQGYRIDYAKNTAGPISTYTPQSAQNPILINSEGSVVGLGHGSAFIGPDLDTYFFCYHNLQSKYGPLRHLNFDRIAWNGDKLLMLGSTTWAQQAPAMPDVYDYFDRTDIGTNWTFPNGGNWSISNQEMLVQSLVGSSTDSIFKAIHDLSSESNYTAEFNLKEEQRNSTSAGFGAIFGYTDENNYGIALLHSYNNKLEVNFKLDGVWGVARNYALPSGYDYSFWHNLRIEKSESVYKIFVDKMLKSTVTSNLSGGKIGYITSNSQADFGFIAFSNKVNGSGIFDTYKPLPGKIQAVHYNNGGQGVGYNDLTASNLGGKYIRNDSVDIGDCNDGGYAIIDNQTGEWYKYNVSIKKAGIYNIGIRYSALADGGQIRIWKDDMDITGIIDLPSTGGVNSWRTLTIKNKTLLAIGFQTLKIEIVNGGFSFYEMNFVNTINTQTTIADPFDTSFATGWNYGDGTWSLESGEANINGYGKRTIGDTGWTDYTVQTDITYYDNMNGGLIFRVNNPAIGGAGNDPALGTDFYQGYYVTLSANAVILGKQNYNWAQLKTASGAYTTNKKYTIKATVTGSNIKIYVDDMTKPKIEYTDTDPFICGKVGLRVYNAHVHFDNFSVTIDNDNQTEVNSLMDSEKVQVYPNPVENCLIIKNINNYTNLIIYNITGQEVFHKKVSEDIIQIDITTFGKGMYILQLSNNMSSIVQRKFIKN